MSWPPSPRNRDGLPAPTARRLSRRRGRLSRNGCATRASTSASMPSATCGAESKAQSRPPQRSCSAVISTACATLAATTARSGSSSPSKPSTISARDDSPLPFPVEVIAFADEEGLRFQTTYLGSCALAGSFDAAFLDLVDENGVTLREAMAAFGGDPGCAGRNCAAPRRSTRVSRSPHRAGAVSGVR